MTTVEGKLPSGNGAVIMVHVPAVRDRRVVTMSFSGEAQADNAVTPSATRAMREL
jgi:hypothetical protein